LKKGNTVVKAPITIAETALTKAVFHKGSSDFLLVTFSPRRNNFRQFWGESVSIKKDITTLGIVAKKPHWYPVDDTSNLISQVLAELPGGCPRIGYGFSMGAYAALKYSKLLGLDATLAFSPQFSIDPNEITDQRFLMHYLDHNRGMGIQEEDLCPRNFVVLDSSHGLDRKNLQRIKERGGKKVIRIRIFHARHSSVSFALGSQTVSDLLGATLQPPREAKNRIREILLKSRKRSPAYYAALVHRAERHNKFDLADRLATRAFELFPDQPKAVADYARIVGRHDPLETIHFLENRPETQKRPVLLGVLARAYAAAGNAAKEAQTRHRQSVLVGAAPAA